LKQSKAISGRFDAAVEYPIVNTLDSYMEALASAAPTPGGGSAATIVGALAAGLVAMVARITAQNPAYAAKLAEAETIASEADALRLKLLEAHTLDEKAYGEVVQAMALPKSTPDEKFARTERLQRALAHAAAEPLHAAQLALDVLALADRAGGLENHHLDSDVSCARLFAHAALDASAINVRVNHALLKDVKLVAEQELELRGFESAAG
jgi:formiminotetrahydrofolate cyclodeaminase